MSLKRYERISKDLEDDRLITCDLGVWFRLERVSSNYGFQRKMASLFQNVIFRDLKVLRRGGDTFYRAVLNKWNLSKLLSSPNLGSFGEDYTIAVNGLHVNEEEGDGEVEEPETPLKLVEQYKKVEDNVLQIDLKKSSEKNGAMARGVHTYNLLCNFTEVENILVHFNIAFDDVEALIKPTPAIPSLLVALKKNLSDWVKETDVRRDPLLLYQPAPQSERMGRTQIWAHAVLEDNQFDRRVTIEGIYKRASIAEIVHTLNYNGDVLTKPQPLTWKGSDIPNGDLMVNMKLYREMNFIIIKGEAFKVSYARQEKQCSHCYSFSHKNFECERWEADGRTLLFDFYKKWQKQVGFKEFQPLNSNPEGELPKTPLQKKPTGDEEEENHTPKSPEHQTTVVPQKTQSERKDDDSAKIVADKDNSNPGTLLEEFGVKYNLHGTNAKSPGHQANLDKVKLLGSVQRKLFEEEDIHKSLRSNVESISTIEGALQETQEKDKPEENTKVRSEEAKTSKEDQHDSLLSEGAIKGLYKGTAKDKDQQGKSPKGKEKPEGLEEVPKPEEDEDKALERQNKAADVKEGTTEEAKKRKHGSSATKLTPENKKVHVNEKPVLIKEIKKMEEEATKKDLTEVKKKVLKSRLETYLNSKKDEIKRMSDDDQLEHERIESNIRSSLDKKQTKA